VCVCVRVRVVRACGVCVRGACMRLCVIVLNRTGQCTIVFLFCINRLERKMHLLVGVKVVGSSAKQPHVIRRRVSVSIADSDVDNGSSILLSSLGR